jgi:diguanylate cyclase (GGDEF)-like protein
MWRPFVAELKRDPGVPDFRRDVHERSAQRRRQSAERRADAAAARDADAQSRDIAAAGRDLRAEVRDRDLVASEAALTGNGHAQFMLRAAENRTSATADRAAATDVRVQAAADREQAARDREQAHRDRLEGQADREALLRQLEIAETDALTGTRARGAGLAELKREIDRASRTTGPLSAAYVDVVGLKSVNDEHGHGAGDALLQRVVRAIRGQLRSYDQIVRLGGDEFLCVMSGASIQEARKRFRSVQAALAADPSPCAIKVGFAALAPDDGAAELIARADADLPPSRRR